MDVQITIFKKIWALTTFNDEQLKAISDILANLGHIAIASIILPFLIPTVSTGAIKAVLLGSLLAILFWSLSVLSVKAVN